MAAQGMNQIIDTYSRLAAQYDGDDNAHSCWGLAADKALASIRLKDRYQVVMDVGCGTGTALLRLGARTGPNAYLVGVEPAPNMREAARARTQHQPQIRIMEGSFEEIPMESGSVDYVYSILAFHWTSDVEQSVNELCRVLKPNGEMDLFFIGRNNGHEFVRKTTPIFLKYMGPVLLLQSAAMRKQLTKDAAFELFERKFADRRLTVEESHETYYDTLERHWSWWVRIEGHFVQIPAAKKIECDREVKQALSTLHTAAGIPYTIHLLHVKVRAA